MGTNQVIRRICADKGIDKICAAAYRESGEATRRRYGTKRGFSPQLFFIKHVVHLRDEPVSLDTFTNFDPDVKTTSGFFSIQYVPMGNRRRYKAKPFVIGQDLVRMRITVSGCKHWEYLCKKIPEFDWIRRWCPTLTWELFRLARNHPGMSFYFSPDWVAYAKMIEAKAKEQGIDIDNKPLVTYAANQEKIAEINSTHFIALEKTELDYANEIREASAIFNTEEE